jgi:glutathione S-transferase
MKLYGDPISGNTKKVRWALGEAGATYTLVPISIGKGEHKGAEFLRLNPAGKVPVLEDEGLVLSESDAILWYVADAYGKGELAPHAPRDRALVHKWMFWNAYHLASGTLEARKLRMHSLRAGTPLDQKRHDDIVASAAPHLALLDAHLSGRDHLVGGALTIADIAVGTYAGFAKDEGADFAPLTNVRRWLEALMERNAWRAAFASGG